MHTQLFTLLWLAVPVVRATSESSFVDPLHKIGTWTGWGASFVWSGKALGSADEHLLEELSRLLFSPDELNLSIFRYGIGGTTPSDFWCGPFSPGTNTESFRDALNKPYQWSRDENARKFLLLAKRHGAEIFEAVVRTPPSWMTKSNCSKGNPDDAPLHDNFDPANANAFAGYLTEVVKYYRTYHGVEFSWISPVYRPSTGEFTGASSTREGCNMERSTIARVIQSTANALRTKGLTFCSVAAADEVGISDTLETQNYLIGSNVSDLYKKVNIQHIPNSGQVNRAAVYTLAEAHDHKLWMTRATFKGTSLPDMTQGIQLAKRITMDIRNLVPSAWVYFEAIENVHDGLISIQYDNPSFENMDIRSGYYVLKHYSKYIKNGYYLVHASDNNTVAAIEDATKTVIVNSAETEIVKTFNLQALNLASVSNIYAYRTSPFMEPHVPILPPVISENQFVFSFPTKSVTTVLVERALPISRDNLIRNGDFESGDKNTWILLHGSRSDHGVNGNYVRRGKFSGYLDFGESMLTLMQNVTVWETRNYLITAWVATTGEGTTHFGVLFNGQQGPDLIVNSWVGYQSYGLSIKAKNEDVISVYLQSEKGNSTAQIDDVTFH